MLFRAAINHEPNIIISELINNHSTDVNAVNERGFTLLQLTARAGMVQATLALLNAGAAVDQVSAEQSMTPYQLAIQEGHHLVAKILLVCGADKNKAPNTVDITLDDVRAILLFAIHISDDRYQGGLLKLVLPQFKLLLSQQPLRPNVVLVEQADESKGNNPEEIANINFHITELICFAAQQKKSQAVAILLPTHFVQLNPNTLSPAYWAAVHSHDALFTEFTKDNPAAYVLALRQLHGRDKSAQFTVRYKQANKQVKALFDQPEEPTKRISTLTGALRVAYQAAENMNEKMFRLFSKEHIDDNGYYLLIQHAWKEKSYVTFFFLLKELGFEKTFKMALEKNANQFACNILFIWNREPLDLLVALPEQ